MQSVARSAYSLQMQLGRRPDTGAYYIRLDGRRISLRKFVGHAVTDATEAKRVFAQVRREVLAVWLVTSRNRRRRLLGCACGLLWVAASC